MTKYPLNTHKHLNSCLNLQAAAFELYISSKNKTLDVIQEIDKIKSGMNRKRSDFEMPKSRGFRITPYWLLGFV